MVAIYLLAFSLCGDDGQSPRITKLIEQTEPIRKERIAIIAPKVRDAEVELNAKEKGLFLRNKSTTKETLPNGKIKFTFPDKATKDAEIAKSVARVKELKDSIDSLKKAKVLFRPILASRLKVGDVGPIVDNRNTVVDLQIVQVIDKDSFIGANGGITLWVDVPTAGLVDGGFFRLDKPMDVIGTKMYSTVDGGTRTAFHLKPFDEAEIPLD